MRVVALLLCLLLALSPGLCLAAEITKQELTKLEEIFNQLEINNQRLLMDLDESKQDLSQARLKLAAYQGDLAALQEQLKQLKDESSTARQQLQTANLSLAKASESLKQSEKEQNRLRLERDISLLALIVLAIK